MTAAEIQARHDDKLAQARAAIARHGVTPEELTELRRRAYGGAQLNRHKVNVAARERLVMALKADGFSNPVIAEAIGYESPAAVFYIARRNQARSPQ